jgi:hypothetical protein
LGLRSILIPQKKLFFQLLEQESKNLLAGAQALRDLVLGYDQRGDKRGHIKDI